MVLNLTLLRCVILLLKPPSCLSAKETGLAHFVLKDYLFLGNRLMTKRSLTDYKTRHNRRKIALKNVAQARDKQYKANPELHPKLAHWEKSL